MGRVKFIIFICSLLEIKYPTLIPAKPQALENVLQIIKFLNSSRNSKEV